MPDALNVLPAALARLLGRASVPARLLREPAPDAGALDLGVAAAGTMNFLNALEMMGFGGVWLSSESLRDGVVKVALGFAETDALVGWVYVGTPGADRPRPEREAPGGVFPGLEGGCGVARTSGSGGGC